MEVKREVGSCQYCASPARVKLECGCYLCGPCSRRHTIHSIQHSVCDQPHPTRSSPVLSLLTDMIEHVRAVAQTIDNELVTQRSAVIGRVVELFQGVSEKMRSFCEETVDLLETIGQRVSAGEEFALKEGLSSACAKRIWPLPDFLSLDIPLWIDRAIDKSQSFVSRLTINPESTLQKWLKSASVDTEELPLSFPVFFSNLIFDYAPQRDVVMQTVLTTTPHINEGTSCTVLNPETVFCSGGKFHSKVYRFVNREVQQLLNMKHSRAYSGQVAGLGCVYVFGGTQWDLALTSAEKYDLRCRKWQPLSDMSRPMCRFNPVLHLNVVYLVGAYSHIGVFYTTSEAYGWSDFSLPMNSPALGFLHGDELLVLQGRLLHRWNLLHEKAEPVHCSVADVGQVWSRTSPLRIHNSVLFCNDFLKGIYELQLNTMQIQYLGSISM